MTKPASGGWLICARATLVLFAVVASATPAASPNRGQRPAGDAPLSTPTLFEPFAFSELNP